jgi:hypothetical protein
MKSVYLCHPIGGDVMNNTKKVAAIYRDLWENGGDICPIAPYILPLLMEWDDDGPVTRIRGLILDCEYVKFADEVWLYGDRISAGMWQEICVAHALGILVLPKTEATAEEYRQMFSKEAT